MFLFGLSLLWDLLVEKWLKKGEKRANELLKRVII